MTEINAANLNERQDLVKAIAKDTLDIPTLVARNSDRLDFYDVSVWSVEAALTRAYHAGYQAGLKGLE